MEMMSAKTELVDMKNELSLNCKNFPTDIMLLINKDCSKSFGRVKTNQKAIIERGQCPHGRILLQHPEIRATMKQEEKLEEINMPMRYKNKSDDDSSLTEELPMTDVSCLSKEPSTPEILNFQPGFTSKCLEKIGQHQDLHEARQRIEKR